MKQTIKPIPSTIFMSIFLISFVSNIIYGSLRRGSLLALCLNQYQNNEWLKIAKNAFVN
jgi:hypothetical protein